MRFVANCVLLVAAGLSAVGCSSKDDDRPERVPVRGAVTYKGKPVEGASVVFSPVTPGNPGASGTTDANGEFVLQTFEDEDGAVPGQYQVGIAKTEIDFSQVEEVVEDPNNPDASYNPFGPPPKQTPLLPKKYTVAENSGLTAEVKAGEENVLPPFQLTD